MLSAKISSQVRPLASVKMVLFLLCLMVSMRLFVTSMCSSYLRFTEHFYDLCFFLRKCPYPNINKVMVFLVLLCFFHVVICRFLIWSGILLPNSPAAENYTFAG